MYRLLMGLLGFMVVASSTYTDTIREWQQQRDQSLRSENGWLTLVGLFWLQPGDNNIGSADSNDFVLPKGSAPEHAGKLRLEGDQVTFIDPNGASRILHYKPEDKPDTVQTGSVSFFVMRRGDKLAVRAKDTASPALKHFSGMKYFPINPAFRFDATFIPDMKKIPILNILGQTDLEESPGVVEFTYQGKSYQLRPIYEGKTLFFLFKDATNRINTYKAGRMLNTPLPQAGKVDLDFNRSYNPPCTFTPYATCPLPPKENTLPFPVEAGEMRYGNGHAPYEAP
jgi:uncharacterized protein (DUF1684 family)